MILVIFPSVKILLFKVEWTSGFSPLSTRLFQKECVKNEWWRKTILLVMRRKILTLNIFCWQLAHHLPQLKYSVFLKGDTKKYPKVNEVKMEAIERESRHRRSLLSVCLWSPTSVTKWSIVHVSLWRLLLAIMPYLWGSWLQACIGIALPELREKGCMVSRVCTVLPSNLSRWPLILLPLRKASELHDVK